MKHISDYVSLLEKEGLLVGFDNKGEDYEVAGYTFNSKLATKGTLFVCKGAAFKEDYLKEAVKSGAVAYISEKAYDVDVSGIIVNNIRVAMAVAAEFYQDYPQKQIPIVGVTGTKGKSTTCYYIKAILDEYEERCGIISTIETDNGTDRFESHITTPESPEVYTHLRKAVDNKLPHMIIESSSQALKYDRLYDVDFDIGVMLNISPDHISAIEHPDFDDYFESKLKIYDKCKHAIVNLDCDHADVVLTRAKRCEDVTTVSTKDPSADFYGYDIRKEDGKISFRVKSEKFDEAFDITMPGLFNVENALVAIAATSMWGVSVSAMQSGLHKARTSGRMEFYESKDKRLAIIVDYAHNKLSFDKLFESVRVEYPEHKISVVFGCPGCKATIRRHDLGVSAGENCDYIYLVPEDPATEDIWEINRIVEEYIKPYNKPVKSFDDRGKGLRQAMLDTYESGEKRVLLITGKGNETRQFINHVYVDCPSDIDYAKMYIEEYDSK